MDIQTAKLIMMNDPEMMTLHRRFNSLGITRFFVWVAAAIIVVILAVQGETVAWFLVGLAASLVTLILNIQRTKISSLQRMRARELGIR
ncbi:hypothetical protein [Arthrobacter caoxuetaonis]|uniref:Uncharacterized protein n=1 Tax=Arthrobacter caoxuetaonis TaxID=2886935 RepID=A0A9X1SGE3_9MICC|nr:hypothetical protein [Arthrobacter caoxuetaonis]MCC3299294.1 hypothetical protein [Arthrobacter caoxuetaonis]USQ59213.1 hypothetical protein NF551_16650 [Arthrobacter caoxuetaonis]